jgi:two-component system, LytTR family, sensor histidine kinase AlgZ
MSNAKNNPQDFYLPDFCQVQSVFLVVLTAELLALIFTLLTIQSQQYLWGSLGLHSLAIQTVTLSSVAVLCLMRKFLSQYSPLVAGGLSLLVILIMSTLFSFAVIKLFWQQSINLNLTSHYNWLMKNLLLSGLIGAFVLRYFYLQQQYHKQIISESAAKLAALQANIRPHFLFNSMNVIASLTRINPGKAETAIEDLSDLFRATLDNKSELIKFSEELEHGNKYLAIEKLRLGQRLSLEQQIDDQALDVLIPPLSLQPLLENAVYHGIQMLKDGGTIVIKAWVEKQKLRLLISNPITDQKNSKGHGIAIDNIKQRLAVIYGEQASLKQQIIDDHYQVELVIPIKKAA